MGSDNMGMQKLIGALRSPMCVGLRSNTLPRVLSLKWFETGPCHPFSDANATRSSSP